jgi:hypothetical protein
LPVQWQVVCVFRHDHLREHTGARGTLLDRLKRLGRGLHRARAGVGETRVFDHFHLRGDIFVALADFLSDLSQILIALRAVLLSFWKIVLDALALQMTRQRLASARPALAGGT